MIYSVKKAHNLKHYKVITLLFISSSSLFFILFPCIKQAKNNLEEIESLYFFVVIVDIFLCCCNVSIEVLQYFHVFLVSIVPKVA